MKIWIRKDLKKNSIMLAFKNANEIFYGDLEPVLYIHVDIEKWTEIDLEEFTKEDHETGISRIEQLEEENKKLRDSKISISRTPKYWKKVKTQ